MAHAKNGASNSFNINKLFTLLNGTNRTVSNNKSQTDAEILEMEANSVEAIIDEYNAVVGEEEE